MGGGEGARPPAVAVADGDEPAALHCGEGFRVEGGDHAGSEDGESFHLSFSVVDMLFNHRMARV
jgi:hypothetical protein